MTIGGGMTCSSSQDLSTVTTCLWQSLDSPVCPVEENTDSDRHGRGLAGSQRLQLQGPRSRHRHSACCVGEYVYLFGGKEGTSPRKDVWRFHIGSCKWETVELLGAGLPVLQGHTSVAYKNLVLIFGGTFSDSVGDAQLWIFDTVSGHVEEKRLKAGSVQPSCRRDHSAVVHNSTMYVYGGFVSSRGANQEMWAFDIDELKWMKLRAITPTHPGGRYSHSAVVANNAMWLFGGMAGLQPKSDLWRYSFLLHQWKKVKALGSPPCLSGHAASVMHRHMVVVGGKCQGRPVSDVWCFSFDTSTWQQVSQVNRLPSLSFHTCVSYCPDQPAAKTPTSCISYSPSQEAADSSPKGIPAGTCSSPCWDQEKNQTGLQMDNSGMEEAGPKGTGGDTAEEQSASSTLSRNGKQTNGDENVADTSDTRVHVSLTEALIPATSSQKGNLSFKPFLKKGSRYVQLKEERIHQSSSASSGNPDLSVQSPESVREETALQSPQVHDSQKPVLDSQKSVPDLIDLSDSPVLKVSPEAKDALLEELGLVSFPSPDGVLASCASRSACPLQQYQLWTEDVGELFSDGLLPVFSQWNQNGCPLQARGCKDWYKPSCQPREVKLESVFPQSPITTKVSDLQRSSANDPEKACSQVDQPELQHWSTTSPSDIRLWEEFQPPTDQADALESDPSLFENETSEVVSLIHAETEATGENRVSPRVSSPRPLENVVSESTNGKKPKKSKNGAGRGERREQMFSLMLREFEQECVLVLGGHSQELVSRPCSSMPVWKGVLL